MPCPFTVLAGIGAVGQAVPTLYVRDRAARPVVWVTTLVLAAGWIAYFVAGRTLALRVTLETLTALALVAGGWRWWTWMRRTAGPAGARHELAVSFRRMLVLLVDPWVLVAVVWLTAMLVMEWRGKAEFVALEYAAIGAWITAMLAWRRTRLPRRAAFATARAGGFAALESYARPAVCPSCPLGFGAGTPDAGGDAPDAAGGSR